MNPPVKKSETTQDAVFGFNDTLLELVNELETIAEQNNVTIDGLQSPFFSLQVNDSATAQQFVSAVYTGKNDTSLLGSFVAWQGNNGSIKTWKGCPADQQSNNPYVRVVSYCRFCFFYCCLLFFFF